MALLVAHILTVSSVSSSSSGVMGRAELWHGVRVLLLGRHAWAGFPRAPAHHIVLERSVPLFPAQLQLFPSTRRKHRFLQSSLTLHSRSRLPLCGFAGPCPPPSPRHECHQLIPRATSFLFVKFGPQMDTFLESHVSADAPHVPRLFKAPPAPSRVIFCLYLLLSLLTASHRQRLQCIQNKSFQPTFQCL